MLQNEEFRSKMTSNEATMFIHQKEFYQWQFNPPCDGQRTDTNYMNPAMTKS